MMRSTTLLIVTISAVACAAVLSGCNIVAQAQPTSESISTTTETDDTGTSTSRTVVVSGDGTRKTTVIVNGMVENSTSNSGHANTPPRIVEKTVPAASVQTVEVRSEFGGITFAPAGDAAQISVRAEITLSDDRLSQSDRKRYLDGFTVETETGGGKLRIYAKPPDGFPKNTGWGASFRVGVPIRSRLTLDGKTSNGAVIVDNTQTTGDVTARSDFGEVRITNAGASAKIDARTSNGAVSVKNDAPVQTVMARSDFGSVTVGGQADTIDARTSNGAVTVKGAKNARTVSAHSDFGSVTVADCGGVVEAVTSNGAVSVEGTPQRLTGKSDFGSVHATLHGTTPQEINLSTSNGSINLIAPASASLRITARTSNGRITTSGDGVQGKSSGDRFDKSFDGTVGGGQSPVSLRTDFGSISITTR